MDLRIRIEQLIVDFVQERGKCKGIDFWRRPLVGFADANHSYVESLKSVIGKTHILPRELMRDASIVICVFVPFTKELGDSNFITQELSSLEWAVAYEETNAMLKDLNKYMIRELEKLGYKGVITPEASSFDKESLMSNWSHRHFAYVAGMGTFGVNNMLITKQGCCGRYTTLTTNLDVSADKPLNESFCLYKNDGSCLVCITNCPAGAIDEKGNYNRQKCYSQCLKNADVHKGLGSSYVDINSDIKSVGTETCGKCTVYTPCAYKV